MRARYRNADDTISFGEVVGYGEMLRYDLGYEPPRMSRTVQVRFEDTDAQAGEERVETLYVNDRYLTMGVRQGTMAAFIAR